MPDLKPDPAWLRERLHGLIDAGFAEMQGTASEMNAFALIKVTFRPIGPGNEGFTLVVGVEPAPATDDED